MLIKYLTQQSPDEDPVLGAVHLGVEGDLEELVDRVGGAGDEARPRRHQREGRGVEGARRKAVPRGRRDAHLSRERLISERDVNE